MPYELGGRSDKDGNNYEDDYIVGKIIDIIEEKINYITIEPIGKDEEGTDLIICDKDGTIDFQQCKARNGSKEFWDITSLNRIKFFTNCKSHLDRVDISKASLVSPLACSNLVDLTNRARSSNGNPLDFIKYQINKSSDEFIKFYHSICKKWDLEISIIEGKKNKINEDNLTEKQITDIQKSIYYLSHIHYRQISDTDPYNINRIISRLFIGDERQIYSLLCTFIKDPKMRAKEIDLMKIEEYLKSNNIEYRNLEKDKRVLPKIKEYNNKFENSYSLINNKLIEREVFSQCHSKIDNGTSLLIYGKAGMGKSGCVNSIATYCEENSIPYLAIKLDKYTPEYNVNKWSENLGFPDSIINCLHSISKNKKAVIILDQLDALRWTQAHSKTALDVCEEIIRNVISINKDRNIPISIVFVTREYDLKNDRGIKEIFNKINEKDLLFEKIRVQNLEEKEVDGIVGKQYKSLSKELRRVLSIPSNLFIWTQLNNIESHFNIKTTRELINAWWKQLEYDCQSIGLDVVYLQKLKVSIIDIFETSNKLIFNKVQLNDFPNEYLSFLESSNLIINDNNNFSFVHQSIIDTFLAENMLKIYYNNDFENITDIIGNLEKQNPIRRFQFQIFMEELLHNTEAFVEFSENLLNDDNVRFSFKYVCFELLHELAEVDDNISDFVNEGVNDERWSKYFINNVVLGNKFYFDVLLESCVIERWYSSEDKKEIVFRLLQNYRGDLSKDAENFIIEHVFKNDEDDLNFIGCFAYYLEVDSDVLFDLRIELYKKHYKKCLNRINFYSLADIKKQNLESISIYRLIKLNTFLLDIKDDKQNSYNAYQSSKYITEAIEYYIENTKNIDTLKFVVESFVQYLPTDNAINYYSEWRERNYHETSIERLLVNVIKNSNKLLIDIDPKEVYLIFKKYLGKGYLVFNEIILCILELLPIEYSDKVVKDLCSNFNDNIFETTSGSRSELFLVSNVLKKHCVACNDKNFRLIEKNIIEYKPDDMKFIYNKRLEYNERLKHNRETGDTVRRIYRSFWGELQFELLQALPNERLDKYSIELINVLNRKFHDGTEKYNVHYGDSGVVTTPMANKQLTLNNWERITTNTKFQTKQSRSNKFKDGCFVSTDIWDLGYNFREVVRKEPLKYMDMFLNSSQPLLDEFVINLICGIEWSEELDKIDNELISKVINKAINEYYLNDKIYRDICNIVIKKKDVHWDDTVVDLLIEITQKQNNETLKVESFDDLINNNYNTVKCRSITAMEHLIKYDEDYFRIFKELLEELSYDNCEEVRFAIFKITITMPSIDDEWINNTMWRLLDENYRFICNLIPWFVKELYIENRVIIENAITKCYSSNDKKLVKQAIETMLLLNLEGIAYIDFVENVEDINADNVRILLYEVVRYFNVDKYNKKAKDIILKCKSFDTDNSLSLLFSNNRLNIDRDYAFLMELLTSNAGNNIMFWFLHYLEESNESLIKFSDIILGACENCIKSYNIDCNRDYTIEQSLSKLILALYDSLYGTSKAKEKVILNRCLDLWDLMYENRIGTTIELSNGIMDR